MSKREGVTGVYRNQNQVVFHVQGEIFRIQIERIGREVFYVLLGAPFSEDIPGRELSRISSGTTQYGISEEFYAFIGQHTGGSRELANEIVRTASLNYMFAVAWSRK